MMNLRDIFFKKNEKAWKPVCVMPWVTLNFNKFSALTHAPCCFLHAQAGEFPTEKESILAYFNSEHIQTVRKKILMDDIDDLFCKECHLALSPDNILYHARNEKQTEILQRALSACQEGKYILDYLPPMVELIEASKCNFHCVMCYQGNYKKDNPEHIIERDKLYRFFDTVNKDLVQINLVGGELFTNRALLDFVNYIARNTLTDCIFSTLTNGSVIKEHEKLLSKFSHLVLLISIDGLYEQYEQIRRGGNFSKLLSNIEWLQEKMESRPGWQLLFMTTIMKTTLPLLPDHLAFAEKMGIEQGFGRMIGTEFTEENIFAYPWLLEGMDWEDTLEETIQYVDRYSAFPGWSVFLHTIRRSLQQNVSLYQAIRQHTAIEKKDIVFKEKTSILDHQKIS